MLGDALILWTIRAALLCYVGVLAGRLWWGPLPLLPGSHAWPRVARWLWTCGCLFFLVHMVAALHFYHHWNWAHILLDTARQTQALIGVPFGEGIYFSFLFAAVWVGDVIAWWVWGMTYLQRPRWLAMLVHAYLFFIAFNGAIVFESGVTRWGGLAACVVLAILGWRSWQVALAFRRPIAPAGEV